MTPEEEVLDVFQQLRKALFEGDRDALTRLMAEDYRGYDPKGRLQDRKGTLEAYGPDLVKLEKYDVRDLETTVIGDVGVITGLGYICGRYAGITFAHDLRFLDLYRRGGKGWQLYISQVTPLETEGLGRAEGRLE
jgi:hypothetical protein